jgi:hypothetical protein
MNPRVSVCHRRDAPPSLQAFRNMRNPFRQFAKATPAPSSTALSSASFVSREYALAVGATTAGAIVLTYVIWRLFDLWLEQATFDKGSVEDHFVLGDTCGAGAQGQVCLAQRKVRKASDESDVVAVKLIRLAFDDGTEILNAADFEQLEREIAVTRQCDHPNVIKTLAAFYHPGSRVEMVMVAARGGEVAQELAERKQYSEADAQAVVRQAANALAYLHGRGIAHRDIKPENVLYADATKRQVKIVDFGFASSYVAGSIPRPLGRPLTVRSLLIGPLPTQRPMDRDSPPQGRVGLGGALEGAGGHRSLYGARALHGRGRTAAAPRRR